MSATELPYDYMEDIKDEMVKMCFGNNKEDDVWDVIGETVERDAKLWIASS